jgi:hypothetical protein
MMSMPRNPHAGNLSSGTMDHSPDNLQPHITGSPPLAVNRESSLRTAKAAARLTFDIYQSAREKPSGNHFILWGFRSTGPKVSRGDAGNPSPNKKSL